MQLHIPYVRGCQTQHCIQLLPDGEHGSLRRRAIRIRRAAAAWSIWWMWSRSAPPVTETNHAALLLYQLLQSVLGPNVAERPLLTNQSSPVRLAIFSRWITSATCSLVAPNRGRAINVPGLASAKGPFLRACLQTAISIAPQRATMAAVEA